LHGEHDGLVLAIQEFDVHAGLDERADLFEIAVGVRRVADDEEALRIEAIDVGVVDDAALLVTEERVVAAADSLLCSVPDSSKYRRYHCPFSTDRA
jgi:hypothetical protein